MKKRNAGRIAVLIMVAGLAAAFWFLDLGRYFTFSYLRETKEHLNAVYTRHSLLVISVYALIYILVTSLSLPGAAVMTIAGGALFGLAAGTVVVSFASTIGATLACAIARYVLRDWVQGRFGQRLKAVNGGIEKEGAFYLFALRLIPVIPFWLVNLVMGLTGLSLVTFYWVSQIGMLPGTIIYVNAGKQLSEVKSLSGILTPGVIVSLALLGLFPLAARKLLALYRAGKRFRDT